MYVLKAIVDLLSCIAHKFSTGTLTFCPKEKEQKFAMKGVTMSMGLLTFCPLEGEIKGTDSHKGFSLNSSETVGSLWPRPAVQPVKICYIWKNTIAHFTEYLLETDQHQDQSVTRDW